MESREHSPDSTWNDVLERAVSSESTRPEGTQLFLEEREDLVVELDSRVGRPTVTHTRLRGLSAHGPAATGRLRYRADPEPEDIAPLVASALEPGAGPPSRRHEDRPREPWPTLLRSRQACETLEQLAAGILQLEPGAHVRGRWVGFSQRIRVARSRRPIIGDVRQGSRVRLEVQIERRGRSARAVEEVVLPSAGSHAEAVTTRLNERLDCREISAGPKCLVFAPAVGGILIHELVGHALEADTALADASWLAACDPPVAARGLRVLDDPRRGRAAWRIDDEGVTARATALVDDGRVVGWLQDQWSSGRTGRPSTGHGRRSSYREPIRPRMGCTFVAAGSYSPDEVLDGIEEGLYIRRMEAASTDPATGRAVFKVTDGDRLCKGKLEAPVDSCLIRVDARESLAGIDRIADDLAFDRCIGSCLRDGQPLATSVGAPTFRIGLASVFV